MSILNYFVLKLFSYFNQKQGTSHLQCRYIQHETSENSPDIKLLFFINGIVFQIWVGLFPQRITTQKIKLPINTNLGGLFRGSLWFVCVHVCVCVCVCVGGGGWWGVKITPCLKPVGIMLETWNLVHKDTHICSFRKTTFQCQGHLNFADASFFCKKSAFLAKMVPLLKAIV